MTLHGVEKQPSEYIDSEKPISVLSKSQEGENYDE